jgi:hypothetical protein
MADHTRAEQQFHLSYQQYPHIREVAWVGCFAVPSVVYVSKAKLPRRRTLGWIFLITELG